MAHTHDRSVIGIDGGGSNCRFALLHKGQRFDVRLGGANASSDRAGALTTLRKGLSDLADAAELPLSHIAKFPTFIGLAGVVDDDMATALAQNLPLHHVQIEDDRRTAMVGALGASDGCVIGIGTGSFIGRRAGGMVRLVGGWGFVLGDDASGADLGRRLLRQVLDADDGLLAMSPLTQQTLVEFGSPAAIVRFAATATPGDFAKYAPRIVDAAGAGDANAVTLMQIGARYIAQVLHTLGWQVGEKLCPIGGLAPHYAPYLTPDIATAIRVPEGSALDGAISLAAQMATP